MASVFVDSLAARLVTGTVRGAAVATPKEAIMARLFTILVMLAFIAGCSGEGTVELTNHTSRYVNGTIKGESYGLPPNGTASRVVEVGSTWKTCSNIDILARVHETTDGTSRVVGERTWNDQELCKDATMRFDVYFTSAKELELIPGDCSGGGIAGP